MANHKSSVKRIRQTATRRLHNRYYAKTMRNAVRKLRATTDKAAAVELLPKVQKMLDKLAKTVAKKVDNDTTKFIEIVNVDLNEKIYGLTLEAFMANAVELDSNRKPISAATSDTPNT